MRPGKNNHLLLIFLILCTAPCFCGKKVPADDSFCSVGSEEFNSILDYWYSMFQKEHRIKAPPHTPFGNGAGVLALREGRCDMAALTVPLTDAQIDSIVKRDGVPPSAIPVAVEALAVIVPVHSDISIMRQEEIASVFEKGPGNYRIERATSQIQDVYGINSASDRYRWFKEAALQGRNYTDRIHELPGPLTLVDSVANSRAGIGYARPAEMTDRVKAVVIDTGKEKILLNAQSASAGKYPYVRFYYIYVSSVNNQGMRKTTLDFLEMTLSPDGQKILPDLGLFALSEQDRLRSLERIARLRMTQ